MSVTAPIHLQTDRAKFYSMQTFWATDLVMVVPIYWYSVPARAKNYLDHWSGWMRVPGLGFLDQMAGKTMWAVSAVSDEDYSAADALLGTLQLTARYAGMHWGGSLLGFGNRPGVILNDTSALEDAKSFFKGTECRVQLQGPIQMNARHNPFPVTGGFETIYAHAVEVPATARTLYVSGQIGTDAQGSVASSFDAQFRSAIANLEQVLAAAHMGIEDVVKLTFYLTRAADLPKLGEIRRELLGIAPAVTTLVISELATPNLLVEVEATAARL